MHILVGIEVLSYILRSSTAPLMMLRPRGAIEMRTSLLSLLAHSATLVSGARLGLLWVSHQSYYHVYGTSSVHLPYNWQLLSAIHALSALAVLVSH